MKTFIIAAITIDGFIAKEADQPAFWTSKEDKQNFVKLTKKAGVVIMGSKTFETINRPLAGRLNIVYSKSGKKYNGVEITKQEPRLLLEELRQRGYKSAAICGGSSIYTLFLEAGLVDTLYLTIEPIVFGKGVSLFNNSLYHNFSLKSIKRLSRNTLLLEYSEHKIKSRKF